MMFGLAAFAAILSIALATGLSLSHYLQWPGKALLDGSDFLKVQQILLKKQRKTAGYLETFALICAIVTLYLIRNHKLTILTLPVLPLIAGMAAIRLIYIDSINEQVDSWRPASLPSHWITTRDWWHRLHIVRFFLGLAATALLCGIIIFCRNKKDHCR